MLKASRKHQVFLGLILAWLPSLSWAGGELLSFKELQKLAREKQVTYLNKLRDHLGSTNSSQLITLQVKDSSCEQKGLFQCHPGLYGQNRCVKYDFNAHPTCLKQKKKDLDIARQIDFGLTVDVPWGILQAETSAQCRDNKNKKFCNELRQLASTHRNK